jgi:L-2,4-diaminobutyrate transaminase
MGLVANAGEVGPYLTARMQEALGDHRHVGEVRGIGMLTAVELVQDRAGPVFFEKVGAAAADVVAAMGRRGVIARAMPQGDILGFAPPLCLSREEADTVVEATSAAVREVLGTD